MTRVIIVDDYRHTRERCAQLIQESGRYEIVAEFANASNVELPCMSGRVDFLLMDVCTADGESGLKMAEKLKPLYPNIKILMMTSMPERSFSPRARAAGCEGFWYKESSVGLVDVMNQIVEGKTVFPDEGELPNVCLGRINSSDITDRELQVLRLLAEDKSYQEISAEMGISVNTVKDHIKRMCAKTDLSIRQLVISAVEHRLIMPNY